MSSAELLMVDNNYIYKNGLTNHFYSLPKCNFIILPYSKLSIFLAQRRMQFESLEVFVLVKYSFVCRLDNY